jgi:spore coat protein CotH
MSMRLRRHYHLPVLFVATAGVLVAGLGDVRIIAYTVEGEIEPSEYVIDYGNDVALFDDTVVHEVQIVISDESREGMVTTYRETGEKDYFPADVIIDGVRINEVGIRLKGNASLFSLGGRGGMGFGGNRDWQRDPSQGDQPQMPFLDRDLPQRMPGEREFEGEPLGEGDLPELPPDDWGFAEGPPGGGMPGGDWIGFGGQQGQPGNLPYLIKLDEYVQGQQYQGYARIALRTSGVGYDASLLQEPVSNRALNAVGVPAVNTAFAAVQFNEGEPQLYSIAAELDQIYIDDVFPESNGVLYKVQQVGNSFAYRGDDPTRYSGIFDQRTAVNEADLAPLIDLLRFVSESTDERFASELDDWIDVDSLAAYLAINNLLVNTDSLAGMGNNYYLYYDFWTERFTILAWDMNESLGDLAMGINAASFDLYWEGVGGRFGRFFEEDRDGGGTSNQLVERFLGTPEFRSLYQEKLEEQYQQLFVDGLLVSKIEQYEALVMAYDEDRDLVDEAEYQAAVDAVLRFVAQRYQFLRTTELLGS